ncbi:MAG: HAD-IC family P-type ATPase [Oscillospiraceae bacterium]|jgi:cation-transporting ATPase E|nr:HAD-IC family P-type ATPase [Oscillospiraceae bacterium]
MPKSENTTKQTKLRLARTDVTLGLSRQEAERRHVMGLANSAAEIPEKSVAEIILSNCFTYFNLIYAIFAVVLIFVRAYRELTFIPIILLNTALGILQETRSRTVLHRMRIIDTQEAAVIRDGDRFGIPSPDCVLGDLVELTAGDEIFADARVVSGSCSVNESLVTGEADEVGKKTGDGLKSGSFLVSGQVRAVLTAVGEKSYVSQLSREAKSAREPRSSEMLDVLMKLVRFVGYMIIPIGIMTVLLNTVLLKTPFRDGVIAAVASLSAMIPQGLYLLVSATLITSIIRLFRKNTLVREMSAIEALARVDTLCIDKTGTITEKQMRLGAVIPLDRFSESQISVLMREYLRNSDDNDTSFALREYYKLEFSVSFDDDGDFLPFTSGRKFSAKRIRNGTYVLGAPEHAGLTGARAEKILALQEHGYRVLVLFVCTAPIADIEDGLGFGQCRPLAAFAMSNPLRKNAKHTFAIFQKRGVELKVISGDSPVSVSAVAGRAGIENADKVIDMSQWRIDEENERLVSKSDPDTFITLADAVSRIAVFGRVTPEDKRTLVTAMQKSGRTVGMTGDGVNDVLALKAADCGVAMAEGAESAKAVSDIVLLHSDFSALTGVVAEGRRVIGNIERSAALFLTKNLFSLALTLLTLTFQFRFPTTVTQMTLLNAAFIGIPGTIFALEPSRRRISGKFLPNVLKAAFPAAFGELVAAVLIAAVCATRGLPFTDQRTASFFAIAAVSLAQTARVGRPLDKKRCLLLLGLVAAFAVTCAIFFDALEFSRLTPGGVTAMLFGTLAGLAAMVLCLAVSRRAKPDDEQTMSGEEPDRDGTRQSA